MKTEKIFIKTDYTKLRNEMHFEVQKKTRMQIFESKKIYNRKKLSKPTLE